MAAGIGAKNDVVMSYSLKDACVLALAAALCPVTQCAKASTASGSAMTVSYVSTAWSAFSFYGGKSGEMAAAIREVEPPIYTGAQRLEPSTFEDAAGVSLPPVFVKNPFLPAKP